MISLNKFKSRISILVSIIVFLVNCSDSKQQKITAEIDYARWLVYAHTCNDVARSLYVNSVEETEITYSPLECTLTNARVDSISKDTIQISFDWVYEKDSVQVFISPENTFGIGFVKGKPAYPMVEKMVYTEYQMDSITLSKIETNIITCLNNYHGKMSEWLSDECKKRGIKK